MNYFDYFSDIEDQFVRRRGSHLMVSTLDWSLMETWKQRGIPLHIVLRSINQTFDQHDKRPQRGRKVNSLFFCRQSVEENYFDYLQSRVGNEAGPVEPSEPRAPTSRTTSAAADPAVVGPPAGETPDPFSISNLTAHLREKADELSALASVAPTTLCKYALLNAVGRLHGLREDLEQASGFSAELLEQDLTLIEESILSSLGDTVSPQALAQIRADGKKLLRGYRETMPAETYRQTLDNYIARELRRMFRIPRLSLFYIRQ